MKSVDTIVKECKAQMDLKYYTKLLDYLLLRKMEEGAIHVKRKVIKL